MKTNLIIAILSICFISCSQSNQSEDKGETLAAVENQQTQATVKNINKNELVDLLKEKESIQLVDVRTIGETSQGTIEGAITEMDFLSGQFENKLNELDKNKPVIVYCTSGRRSANAAEILVNKDFKKVYNYTGGYSDWSN